MILGAKNPKQPEKLLKKEICSRLHCSDPAEDSVDEHPINQQFWMVIETPMKTWETWDVYHLSSIIYPNYREFYYVLLSSSSI